jgi:hypothetical protein
MSGGGPQRLFVASILLFHRGSTIANVQTFESAIRHRRAYGSPITPNHIRC